MSTSFLVSWPTWVHSSRDGVVHLVAPVHRAVEGVHAHFEDAVVGTLELEEVLEALGILLKRGHVDVVLFRHRLRLLVPCRRVCVSDASILRIRTPIRSIANLSLSAGKVNGACKRKSRRGGRARSGLTWMPCPMLCWTSYTKSRGSEAKDASLRRGRVPGLQDGPLVARTGMPRRLRGRDLSQGRQGRQGGGRRRPPLSPGQALPARAGADAVHPSSRPSPLPAEARGRARLGQVGAHQLGRGAGHLRTPDARNARQVRRREHDLRPGHRPRLGRPHHLPGLRLRQPQLDALRPLRHRLLHPAPGRVLPGHGRHDLPGRGAVLPAALRRSGLEVPRADRQLGPQPAGQPVRRPLLQRPLRHRHDEARRQAHRRRPLQRLGGLARRTLAAHPAGHRRRSGPGHDQGHHRGGPLRQGVRREVDLRLRQAEGTRGHDVARRDLADHLGPHGQDRQGRPHVRRGQAGADALRPAAGLATPRPSPRIHAPGQPLGAHRQHRQPRRQRHLAAGSRRHRSTRTPPRRSSSSTARSSSTR